MPRNRLTLATLAFVVVASACGGDDPRDSADPEEDARPSVVAPETGQQGTDQPGTVSELVVIRLGNRFEWCRDIQIVWDTHDAALVELRRVNAERQNAQEAYESATDQLDKAEARILVDAADAAFSKARTNYEQAARNALYQIDRTRETYGSSPEDIAYQRAWSALLSEDADLATIAVALPDDPFGSVPERISSASEILEEVFGTPNTRLKPVVQEAAYEVYSQADHTLIVEALVAAAPEAGQAAAQAAAQATAYGKQITEARADGTRVANYIFQVAAYSVLAPYDAAAFEAAHAAAPNASLGLIDSPEAYVRSITDDGMDGSPTFYRYLLEDSWFETRDRWEEEAGVIALFAFNGRTDTVQDALPIALEAAREAEAVLEAEAEAERTRERETEAALQAALEELIQGSDAYAAFKRSFEGSCQ